MQTAIVSELFGRVMREQGLWIRRAVHGAMGKRWVCLRMKDNRDQTVNPFN